MWSAGDSQDKRSWIPLKVCTSKFFTIATISFILLSSSSIPWTNFCIKNFGLSTNPLELRTVDRNIMSGPDTQCRYSSGDYMKPEPLVPVSQCVQTLEHPSSLDKVTQCSLSNLPFFFYNRWTYNEFFCRYRVLCRSWDIKRNDMKQTCEKIISNMINVGV